MNATRCTRGESSELYFVAEIREENSICISFDGVIEKVVLVTQVFFRTEKVYDLKRPVAGSVIFVYSICKGET